MSVQSRVNGELETGFKAPLDAALWSFGSGWLPLTLVLLLAPRVRGAVRSLPERCARAVALVAVPRRDRRRGLRGGPDLRRAAAGVAIFTIAVVGGQTANALLVDKLGLGPRRQAPVTVARALSAALAFVGVVVAVSARGGGPGRGGRAGRWSRRSSGRC